MKNTKKGFSLAEVLITASIAAIIATIGFTVAKKSAENAFNLYIYNGYNSMYLAINDASSGYDKKISQCGTLDTANCEFTEHVYNLLSGRNQTMPSGELEFDVPNGIKYRIYNYGSGVDSNGNAYNEYRIAMTVPTVKTSNAPATKKICMSYQPDVYRELLIPIGNDPSDNNCSSSNMINDIASRIDLLAFYLDDGLRGKVVSKDGVSTKEYNPRRFRTAEQAFCWLYGSITGVHGDIYSTARCDAVKNMELSIYGDLDESGLNSDGAFLRVVDPRRV